VWVVGGLRNNRQRYQRKEQSREKNNKKKGKKTEGFKKEKIIKVILHTEAPGESPRDPSPVKAPPVKNPFFA